MDRIKLKADDIEWLQKMINDNIVCWNTDEMSVERGNQILSNGLKKLKEKADKYDKVFHGKNMVNKAIESVFEDNQHLEAQVKELKEKAEKWDMMERNSIVFETDKDYLYDWGKLERDNEQLEAQVKELKFALQEEQDHVNDIRLGCKQALQITAKENQRNNKLYENIIERLDWYEKENEECSKKGLFGRSLHYDAIIKELKQLIEGLKEEIGNQTPSITKLDDKFRDEMKKDLERIKKDYQDELQKCKIELKQAQTSGKIVVEELQKYKQEFELCKKMLESELSKNKKLKQFAENVKDKYLQAKRMTNVARKNKEPDEIKYWELLELEYKQLIEGLK